VKVSPNYKRGQAVYVTDASRAVGVASSLIGANSRDAFIANVREEYDKLAAAHARSQESKQRLPLAAARANRLALDWSGSYQPPRPPFVGTRLIADQSLAELVNYIDWTPFF